MNLFYTPGIQDDLYSLDEIESHHCLNVLRMKNGDIVHSIDGLGNFIESQIVEIHKKKCVIKPKVIKPQLNRRNYYLHVAMAPTKNIERFEWFLEKATEIGIDEITPLLTKHSERKIIKIDRLEKVIIAAMKQSLNAFKPKLNELIEFKEFMKNCAGEKYIAHCHEGIKPHLKNLCQLKGNYTILIGPEGDFSTNEVEIAKSFEYKEVTLGDFRLRTETAGIVACHAIAMINQGKNRI